MLLPFSVNNLRRNWVFPLSVLAYFCLQITLFKFTHVLSILLAVSAAVVLAGKTPSHVRYLRKQSPWFLISCLLTSIGVCLGAADVFTLRIHTLFIYADAENAGLISGLDGLASRLSMSVGTLVNLFDAAALFAALLGVFCITLWTVFLLRRLWQRFRPLHWLEDTPRWELAVYGLLFLAAAAAATAAFLKSQAFYGTDYFADVIYTTDSPAAVKRLWLLTDSWVDIKHPLFPFFSAPFTGLAYLLSRLFPSRLMWSAILMNYAQIFLLILANYLLARLLHLTPGKRLCFTVPLFFTYSCLFSTLAVETYVISYLWLILFLHLILEQKQQDPILLWGAGGTLLTSLVLTPLMSDHSPIHAFRKWFLDMWRAGLGFLFALVAFGNADLLLNLFSQGTWIQDFTGDSLVFSQRLLQYLVFLPNCFLSPESRVLETGRGRISWWLMEPTAVSVLGIGILLLVLCSFLVNRKNKLSQLSFFWVCFSFVILCLIGWGTRENGLNLYALVFAWAIYVLLFQLVEKISDCLHSRYLLPLVCGAAAIGLLLGNLPGLYALIQFAIQTYPA